jgi:hypothetical protein
MFRSGPGHQAMQQETNKLIVSVVVCIKYPFITLAFVSLTGDNEPYSYVLAKHKIILLEF